MHLSDLWKFEGGSWTQVPTVSRPSTDPLRLSFRALAFDSNQDSLILVGGEDVVEGATTWEFDGDIRTGQLGGWTRRNGIGPHFLGSANLALGTEGLISRDWSSMLWQLPATRLGTGCPTSPSAIAKLAGGDPVLAQTWNLGMSGMMPAVFVAVGQPNVAGTPIPGMTGCTSFLATISNIFSVTANPGGDAMLSIAVPNDPSLVGVPVAVQAITGNGNQSAVSNALLVKTQP